MKDGIHSLKKLLEDHRITLKEKKNIEDLLCGCSILGENGNFFRFKSKKKKISE